MFCCSECEALPNPARDDLGGGGNSGQPDLQLRCRPGTRNGWMLNLLFIFSNKYLKKLCDTGGKNLKCKV
jgi:hypothetical protein